MTHIDIHSLVLAAEEAIDTLDDEVSERLGAARYAIANLDLAYDSKAAEADRLRERVDELIVHAEVVDDEPATALPVTPGAHILVTGLHGGSIPPTEAVLIGRDWCRVDGELWRTEDVHLQGWMIATWEPLTQDQEATV